MSWNVPVFKSSGLLSVAATARTGLTFPSNGGGGSTVQFRFTGTAMPDIQPLTIIWRLKPVQQSGYYTTFFHARTDGSFVGDETYFGCHPYPNPPPSGTAHNWEVSTEGTDDTTDENSNSTIVTKAQWYSQAASSRANGGSSSIVDFYWDLDTDSGRRISHTMTSGTLTNATASPALTFGDAPWSENNERLSGTLRGIQIYTAQLSESDIITEAANDTSNTPQTAAGQANVWYMNQNPTPDDISDKSGEGNNPAWINAERPTLWEE